MTIKTSQIPFLILGGVVIKKVDARGPSKFMSLAGIDDSHEDYAMAGHIIELSQPEGSEDIGIKVRWMNEVVSFEALGKSNPNLWLGFEAPEKIIKILGIPNTTQV